MDTKRPPTRNTRATLRVIKKINHNLPRIEYKLFRCTLLITLSLEKNIFLIFFHFY